MNSLRSTFLIIRNKTRIFLVEFKKGIAAMGGICRLPQLLQREAHKMKTSAHINCKRCHGLLIHLTINLVAFRANEPTWTDVAIRAAWNVVAVLALLIEK